MKMGVLEYRQNVKKTVPFEADYYYDVKLQDGTGHELYARFTAVEIREARHRSRRQASELVHGRKRGHVLKVKNEINPGTESTVYYDLPAKLVFPTNKREEEGVLRFTPREFKRAVQRGITQDDEITKTSWFVDLFD